jgi:hypothetical protein
MIPESWLKNRMETTDVLELAKHDLASAGFSDADIQELFAKGPSSCWLDEWRDFIAQMIAGDRLWYFTSPPETWGQFAGVAGYALVRSSRRSSRRIVASITTRKS